MKILIHSDQHWSKHSSVIDMAGEKYSKRLELLINSINWAEALAVQSKCDQIWMLGDFFDKSIISDQEVSALNEIKWSDLKHYVLVGNHESSIQSLDYTTVDCLENDNFKIIKNSDFDLTLGNTQVLFVPYVLESNRQSLVSYLTKYDKKYAKHIICSHNEISGINYGAFESKLGFTKEEIESNCDLYLNGHLHNSSWITDKILNVGSLSAHNFTNDSFNYKYGAWILDTDTLKLEFYENPFSLNFYKFEVNSDKDINLLDKVKNNAVLSIKCADGLQTKLEEKLNSITNKILYKKISVIKEYVNTDTNKIETLGMNHLEEFIKFTKEKIDNTSTLDYELGIICRE